MTQTVKSNIPASLVAGDSTQWKKSLCDYPASDGWQLHYTLNSASHSITIDSTADDDDHLVAITAAASAGWVAGEYSYVAWVDGVNSERHTLENGLIDIAPNLAAQTSGFDVRTSAKKCLDQLNAALETYGNKAYTQSYTIAGRTMSFQSPGEFMAFRSKIKAEVAKENRLKKMELGQSSGSKILTRF